jgi:CMP-N-acetylneuraminic acid synthetase
MKILTVIPARGGSKGVPRKNVRELCGRPLIYYVINAAMGCDLIDKVIMSTDDEEIAQKAKGCGAEVPFMRPKEISGDKVSLIPVVQHALKYFDGIGLRYDAVISLQPTSPFVTTSVLCRVIEKMEETGCDSIVSVHEIIHGHPYRAKRLINGDKLDNFFEGFNGDLFLQKQDRPPAYAYNGAVYLRKRELIENYSGKDFGLGRDVRAIIMDPIESINIDTETDFRIAEILMNDRSKNKNGRNV